MYLLKKNTSRSMITSIRSGVWLSSAFVVLGCNSGAEGESWPSFGEQIATEFDNKLVVFERIVAEMDNSGLEFVSYLQENRIRVLPTGYAEADFEEPKNIETWRELLRSAEFVMVEKHGYSVRISEVEPKLYDSKKFLLTYVRQTTSPIMQCLPIHADIECGLCSDNLNGDWSVVYTWQPVNLYEGQDVEFDRDKLPNTQNAIDESESECMTDGLKAMGYDDVDLNEGD